MNRFFPFSLFLLLASAWCVHATELKTWDRYRCIVERAPFGPIFDESDPAFSSAPEAPVVEAPIDEGPKLSDIIKLSAITVFGGTPAAGFTDTSDGRSYYLLEGRSAGDITLVEVHAKTKSILLRKGEKEEEIFLFGQSPTGEQAPAAAPTTPGIRAVGNTATPASGTAAKAPGYKELQRKRFEEARQRAREKAEEERKRRQEELAQMSDEEAEKKLREYNLELIRTGDGPPLPIELNRSELEQLGKEGFDVTEAIQALDEKEKAEAENPGESRAERIRRRREAARARAAAAHGDAAPPMP